MAGQVYRFLGRWEEGQRGPQFKAATYTLDEPGTKVGTVKYLADHCDGVGTRLAERLWQAFGAAAVQTLRERPEDVVAAGILSGEAASAASADLKRFAHLERTRIDLFGLVAGRGFPGKVVDRAIAKWGAKAPAVVRANPFRLLTAKLPGAGFKRCDQMYLDGGGRATSLKRLALAGWNVLREDRSGSTWVPAADVVAGITAAVPAVAPGDTVKGVKLAVRGGLIRVRRNGAERWVAAAEHARQEQRLADAVGRILASPARWPDMPEFEPGGDLPQPSPHQAGELAGATGLSLGCLVGGAGTGKTFALAALLRLLLSRAGPAAVAVCAPTGKAARRATEAMEAAGLPLRATTIHQLLEIGRNGHDGGGWGFQRHRDNPLPCPFLVVDEASMLDTGLAADLLDAVPPGGCVLLVGDPDQLSPVGHGAPLRDLLAGGRVSVGRLTEVRRNAGGIVRGGAAIRAGGPVEFAARLDLAANDPVNLKFIECATGRALDVVADVLRAMTRFDPVWDTQILCGVNDKGELSRAAVNERFAKLLNPDGRRVPGVGFAAGDKVICLKNGMLKRADSQVNFRSDDARNWRPGQEEQYVANGEGGRVIAVGAAGCVVEVGEVAVWVPKGRAKADDEDGDGKAGGGLGDWCHAYAVTCHKSQGSEWPCVIVLADPAAGGVADRHWWYTAVTRARGACLVVGDRGAFESQRRRGSLARRKTFLCELLADTTAKGAK